MFFIFIVQLNREGCHTLREAKGWPKGGDMLEKSLRRLKIFIHKGGERCWFV